MFQRFHHRGGHYALLVAVSAGLFLVNLGTPSLWDIDEGHNAEAAREMMVAGNAVVPTFNYELRTDKPALLYWLQIGAYRLLGVNEFAARLPSALAALGAVLVTYELGVLLFGASAGLLAGLVLASTVMFCAAAHFANPDALLLFFSSLSLLFFWRSFARGGRGWFVPAGIASGLAVLAKGPVGLVLPGAVVVLFLLWCHWLRLLFDRRLGWGVLAFGLVALPWYGWVAAETKGQFLRGFFLTHNVNRFVGTLENHGGPIFYYPLVLLAGFAPWSAFLGLTGWYGFKALRSGPSEQNSPAMDPRWPFRFLWCWVMVYGGFFSLSGTKLPNYILPLYPPTALLTAWFLDQWRRGELQPPGWALKTSLACLALMGLGTVGGFLVAGGVIDLPSLKGRH
jgi:4-amino-4-deoxy-L-arabinose transferase-like glycosyltransferase